jgi:hypothetical protein
MYWENGISAQYSFENFKPNQFFSVLILYHLGSVGTGCWELAPPFEQVSFYSDLEEDMFKEIPNTAFFAGGWFCIRF